MGFVYVHLVPPPFATVLEAGTKQQTLANKGGVEIVAVWCRKELMFFTPEVPARKVRYTYGRKRPFPHSAQEISIAETHRLLTGFLKPLSGARIQSFNAEMVSNRPAFTQMVNRAVKLIINDAQLGYMTVRVNLPHPSDEFVPIQRIVRLLQPYLTEASVLCPGFMALPPNGPRLVGDRCDSFGEVVCRYDPLTTVSHHVHGNGFS